ncbi:MAG: hypothetical protein H6595_07125 [Flavobacteriales bacterium]|nr:hypothetical protein [Flavobacteriales bacterium]MCB9167238.1 hypothetical protein [Flavobacteriales bacterium]
MRTDRLPKDWILAPAIDLELKQYLLLAYLQRVEGRFSDRKLYPELHEVQAHLDDLQELHDVRESLLDSLPRTLLGIDLRDGTLVRERTEDPEVIGVITEVIGFALPRMQETLTVGEQLRHELAQCIHFAPVGLLPLDAREGYLLLRNGREALVYAYAMPIYREVAPERFYRSVVTQYVSSFSIGLATSYERIKMDLVRRRSELPNPAMFSVEADLELPRMETFMPLAKQLVYRYITSESGH